MATYAKQDRPQKDPTMAGMLSILPGLGQLYNGETRKGMLFLAVGVINFLVFLGLLFNESILQGLYNFGLTFNMEPNKQLIASMMNFRLGNPASMVIISLFLAFTAFCMRDAYDHAAVLQRKQIYADAVMDMPEASSGSYLFHVALMITCLILAFFFLIPPPPKVQVTDIEFIQNQPEVKKQIRAKRKAEHNSENRGQHNPQKKVAPPSPAPKQPSQAAPTPKPQARPTPKPVQQERPTPTPTPKPAAQPTPRPTPRPSPSAAPTPTPTPRPTPAPAPMAAPTPTPTPTPSPSKSPVALPNPIAAPAASPRANPTPVPAPVSIGKVGAPAAPNPALAALPSSSSGSMPAPIASISTRGTSGGGGARSPVPVMAGGGGGGSKGGSGSGPAAAPAPSRAGSGSGGGSGSGESGPSLAVAPSVPRPSAGSGGGGGGEGSEGNPDRGAKPGRPSLAAQKDVDFGPYMADLQRRIKRAWFPPKGNESKRVSVVFKIHSNGTMSNLRLAGGSGLAIADQAALKAVQNAAPFRPLPDGAPSDVDIQFTFDYNVFKGSGSGGVFRRF